MFLVMTRALRSNDSADAMFADINFGSGENKDSNLKLLKVNKRMHEGYKYLQERHNLQRVTARLNLVCRSRLLRGIPLLQTMLSLIHYKERLFVLELEQSKCVHIPKAFSQRHLPACFQFYDPLTKIIQRNVDQTKQKYFSIQTSYLRFYQQKYDRLRAGDEVPGQMPAVRYEQNPARDDPLGAALRVHCQQLQNSAYIKINDNQFGVNLCDALAAAVAAGSPAEQLEQLKAELGKVQIEYVHYLAVAGHQRQVLKFKLEFLVKLAKMKLKGEALAKLARITGFAEQQEGATAQAKQLAINYWDNALFEECRRKVGKYRHELKEGLSLAKSAAAQIDYLDA